MNGACFSRGAMTRFLAGEVPAQEESDVADHLGRCPRCHEMAGALSDVPDARRAMTGRRTSDVCAMEGSLNELQGRLQALALYDDAEELQTEATSSTIAGGETQG